MHAAVVNREDFGMKFSTIALVCELDLRQAMHRVGMVHYYLDEKKTVENTCQ